jgi:hypothetical protein
MPRLFISYSRMDEVFARQLATSLSTMGGDIWIDIRDIPAGMKWSSAIQEGLDNCDAMIIIISPASMASQNVEDEWQYYRDRGKIIVPVMIQPTQLHYQLGRLQYINFHTQPYNIALSQLHAELYRKGIILSPPPNAVTQPVPRAPAGYPKQPAYTPPQGQPAPRPRQRGNSLVTIGCAAVLGIGALLGVGALLASNLLNPAAISTLAQTQTAVAVTNEFISTQVALTATANSVGGTPAPQHGIVRIVAESARLRSGPGTNFTQVGEALRGQTFEVVAQAQSSTGTSEVWYLIDRSGGAAWISSVTVEITPANALPPTALTLPPTPTVSTPTATETATSVPTPTASLDSATDVIQATIAAAGVPYNFGFNAGRFNTLRIATVPYAGSSLRVIVRDVAGNVIIDQREVGSFTIPILANQDYTLEVTDTNGGSGSFNIIIERSLVR